jgi:hypothetical protein
VTIIVMGLDVRVAPPVAVMSKFTAYVPAYVKSTKTYLHSIVFAAKAQFSYDN